MIEGNFDKKCDEILKAIPTHIFSRNCFRSALKHLELAEKLYPIDSAMSVFRYITAEEEAASGLIRCLQEKGYTNAKKLYPRKHEHKHSVIPFFSVLCQFLEEQFKDYANTYDLIIDENRRIKLVIEMQTNGQTLQIIPDPPLNFQLRIDGKRIAFREQIEKLASSKGVESIIKHIEDLANLRNQLLYASPNGCPVGVKVEDKFFTAYQMRVFSMLRAYLMIVPYDDKLPFVQDCLDALLNMMGQIKFDDFYDGL